MPTLEEHFSDHEEPIDQRAHKRLLDAVGRLNKTQFIKKPTRSEPAIRRSEFHLVKTNLAEESEQNNKASKAATVSVPDLVKVLNRTSKHLSIGKELKTNDKTKKVLEKPLERPVADRIARSVGYEKAKQKLNRWNAVVTRNRATDHMSFPLKQDGKSLEIIDGNRSNYSHFRIQSELGAALKALDPKPQTEVYVQGDGPEGAEEDPELKLSRAEMIARSKELRLLRIRESHKSAKARMQNKIKSKKFHKILKKEKLKEQMKEFEALQKDDPEAAMRKLDSIEKQRAEERALLRHKNTGTWAKNLQVRAKYDKDVRKELSQQLAIGRELTQRRNASDDEDAEEDDGGGEDAVAVDAFNPWLKSDGAAEASQQEADSVGGYRKYWNERNENEEALRKWREEQGRPTPIKLKPKVIKSKVGTGWLVQECSDSKVDTQLAVNGNKKVHRKVKIPHSDNIDDLFDDAEETLRTKVSSKLKKLNKNLVEDDGSVGFDRRQKSGKRGAVGSNSGDLSFKQTAKRANIDEALDYGDDAESIERKAIEDLRNLSNQPSLPLTKSSAIDNINPNTFIQVKPKHLRTALPEIEGAFDELDDESGRQNANKRLTIAEAFEDDDILADFERDKDAEKRKGEPEEINLTLPGWGSWAGTGIEKRQPRKKLILKFPKPEERREENKGHVIIVDNDNRKLRQHQVSKLPFPFTSVAEYEASIRAPIGRDFVPASAHQLLIKPAVTTQLGAIIEPMKDEILLRRPTAPRTKTSKKIAELNKEAAARKEKKK